MKHKVTVLINTVNENPTRLESAIKSYLEQKNVDVQILVSTVKDDISIEIAKRLGCDVIINDTKGIYEQLNNAVNYITGDWWCYASGHDLVLPGKLFNEVECCIKNNKKICYSDYIMFYPKTGVEQHISFFDYSYQRHIEKGNFVNDCAMINTELSKKYFPFKNEEWGNDSFYDFWLRVFEGEGNVFCYNNSPTWIYIQYDDSKHIVRQKSEEELLQYKQLRKDMLASHVIQPKISVGLPVYKCKLAWLAMEGLIRQKTTIPWELIICEDELGAHGKDYFMKYKNQLLEANCISIKYISIPKTDYVRDQIALSLKWKIIASNTSISSVGMVMQDADDYSEPNRIQTTYERFQEGYDWVHSRFGLFYHVHKDKTILFDLNTVPQPNTGLSKAIKLDIARQLPEEQKFSSVDNWIFSSMMKIKPDAKVYYDESSNYLYCTYTDGENIISKSRERNYDNLKYPFMKTSKKIRNYLPIEVYSKLAHKEKIIQAAVSRSVQFFEDKLFDKYGFINRRSCKTENFVIDLEKPLLMFGCYTQSDFTLILNHKSDVVIIWAGSDSMPYNYNNMRQFVGKSHIHHISGSKFISDDLDMVGLEYKYYPISLCDHSELKPKPLGDKIYVYTARGKNDPEFYGKSLYDKLIDIYGPEKFVLANADTYSKENVYQLYEQCFIGLRLVKHDGLSETVAELGLMGRNIVYNGDTPNSLNYSCLDDIIFHIENEMKKKDYIDYQLAKRMEDFLDTGTDWLYIKHDKSKEESISCFPTKNKLGAAYSVFDDLDHLEQSLLSIRDNVDFITIVYQNVSYTGIQAEFNIYSKLVELKNKKLIDGIAEYKPDFNLSTKENEVKKRNLGLLLCKQNYCTHHITMDGDEIYVPAQFKKAKAIVYDYQYEASFVLSRTYYKSKSYYINPPEQYHIPFIYKISDRKFEYQAKINLVSADSSRVMNNVTEDIMIFERQFIEMHHLCYVRKDMKRKLQNKASNLSEEKIEKILNSYDNFKLLQLTQEVYTENGTFNVRLHLFPAI